MSPRSSLALMLLLLPLAAFAANNCSVDLWPEVSEYKKTYPTGFKLADGSPARVFSSGDASTVDLHFHWMQEYGIDGVFMQRFFDVTRTKKSRADGRVILGHALKASQKHGRALAVMYDLSGLKPGEDCSSLMQDWKELVDALKLTGQAGRILRGGVAADKELYRNTNHKILQTAKH